MEVCHIYSLHALHLLCFNSRFRIYIETRLKDDLRKESSISGLFRLVFMTPLLCHYSIILSFLRTELELSILIDFCALMLSFTCGIYGVSASAPNTPSITTCFRHIFMSLQLWNAFFSWNPSSCILKSISWIVFVFVFYFPSNQKATGRISTHHRFQPIVFSYFISLFMVAKVWVFPTIHMTNMLFFSTNLRRYSCMRWKLIPAKKMTIKVFFRYFSCRHLSVTITLNCIIYVHICTFSYQSMFPLILYYKSRMYDVNSSTTNKL